MYLLWEVQSIIPDVWKILFITENVLFTYIMFLHFQLFALWKTSCEPVKAKIEPRLLFNRFLIFWFFQTIKWEYHSCNICRVFPLSWWNTSVSKLIQSAYLRTCFTNIIWISCVCINSCSCLKSSVSVYLIWEETLK